MSVPLPHRTRARRSITQAIIDTAAHRMTAWVLRTLTTTQRP